MIDLVSANEANEGRQEYAVQSGNPVHCYVELSDARAEVGGRSWWREGWKFIGRFEIRQHAQSFAVPRRAMKTSVFRLVVSVAFHDRRDGVEALLRMCSFCGTYTARHPRKLRSIWILAVQRVDRLAVMACS